MVAPHDTGEVLRSLVHVRGSGRDKTLPGNFCNLGRVSTLAAGVQVNATLPRELAQPQAPAKSSADEEVRKRSSAENKKSRQNPLARGQRTTNAQEQPSQPQRIQNEQGSNLPMSSVTGMTLLTPVSVLQTQNSQQGRVAFIQPGIRTVSTLPRLLEELKDLQSQNAELKKRLSLFQQLFRDRQRLTSVVQRLRSDME